MTVTQSLATIKTKQVYSFFLISKMKMEKKGTNYDQSDQIFIFLELTENKLSLRRNKFFHTILFVT